MICNFIYLCCCSYCTVDQGSSKVFLLPKILSVTVRVIQKDAEEKKAAFSRRAYFRLFLNWLLDHGSPDPVLDSSNFQVHFLYKGTLRVLLVLLHDFPEFLCDYHFSFCDVIPASCIPTKHEAAQSFYSQLEVGCNMILFELPNQYLIVLY
ncbi:general negative regulator of transcription subunit 1-like [Magnolia sinica]|uniref:general negative regulator of transcription subunit 1-like n=1 Tax=Magnolia sinica TaxID=86752 RepID=UPI00265AF3A4|nr:general negative regulator of transcription subunit 1-like [Magnolia sinica]